MKSESKVIYCLSYCFSTQILNTLTVERFFKSMVLLLLLISCKLHAATITATGNGNWSSTVNNAPWSGGVVPTSGDDVIISGGVVVTVDGNYSCNSLTIGAASATSNTLQMNSGVTLTVTGSIAIIPPNGGTNDNTLAVNAGIVTCTGLTSSNSSSNLRDCKVLISTGTLTVNGNIAMGTTNDRNDITFTGAGLLQVSGTFVGGTFVPASGTVEYNAAGVQTLSTYTSYGNIKISGSGTKSLASSVTLTGNLSIVETAALDVTVTPYSITVAGNWIVTSSVVDPFIEQTGTVTFNGSSGTQSISTVLATGETFYKLAINNTSGAVAPQISTSSNIIVACDFDHTSGTFNLTGKTLSITGNAVSSETITLSNASLVSSITGALFTISDPSNYLSIAFSNYVSGSATVSIDITASTYTSSWLSSTFYGTTNFTKNGVVSEVFGGGNIFYGPCTYTNVLGLWNMGANSTTPDIFYNATFISNSSSSFVIANNSIGTEFYGTTTFTVGGAGAMYITRDNNTGSGTANVTFHGPVVVNLQGTASVRFADAAIGYLNTVTFEGTIQINSTVGATSDVYFGKNEYSTIVLTATAQFITGTLSGYCSIYMHNLTQNGTLTQTINDASGTILYCGTTTPVYCVFNGTVAFEVDTMVVTETVFNGNTNLIGNQSLLFSSCDFNGATNTITKNGAVNNTCSGDNVFASGTNTTIQNGGTGNLRLANTTADDYNGNVTFQQLNSGILSPAYNTNCTFSGNISTTGTTTAITFASNTNGRVTIDGNGIQTFSGSSSQKPIIKRLTMVTSAGGYLSLSVPIDISSSGDLTFTSGKIITTATNILTLLDETTNTSIGNSSSYIDGPMAYIMSKSGTSTLNLPLGKSSSWRPAVLTLTHNATTAYTYTAELFNASAAALGYTLPATIDNVSAFHYWQIDRTSSASTNLTAATIQLYYDSEGVNDAPNLRIAKTIGAGTAWNDIGGVGTANTTGSITSTVNFTSFCKFTLANNDNGANPLPVSLLYFNADCENEYVKLKWATATEFNNDFFRVERSFDGENWEVINEQDGAGISVGMIYYSFVDELRFPDVCYYRLKQTDFNGDFTYSSIISSISCFTFSEIELFPNPCENKFSILLENLTNENISYSIHTIIGENCTNSTFILNQYSNELLIDTSALNAGCYYVTIFKNGKKCGYNKLIIK